MSFSMMDHARLETVSFAITVGRWFASLILCYATFGGLADTTERVA